MKPAKLQLPPQSHISTEDSVLKLHGVLQELYTDVSLYLLL